MARANLSTPNRTERSAATRARIIAVAVRLFAERGLEGVSLNDINKAAGQRNKNATHYHFGSKEGLLQAILDTYEPRVSRRRDELLDQYEAHGPLNVRLILRAIIQPLAEALDEPGGAPDFVRFSSQLVVSQTLAVLEVQAPTYNVTSARRVAQALDQHLGHLSPALKLQRGVLLGVALTHSLAEHSQMRQNTPDGDSSRLTALFVANLEDCLAALLLAPPSDETLSLLGS